MPDQANPAARDRPPREQTVSSMTAAAPLRESPAADQSDIAVLDQGAGRGQPAFGLYQVEHRHQYFLAHDFAFFHPDNVVSQRCRLLTANEK